MLSDARTPVHVTRYVPGTVLSGTDQLYCSRPIPSSMMPVPVVATGVPWPLSAAPDAAIPMVTSLAAHACPELTLTSNWTINSRMPPGKTSELALVYGVMVGISAATH